jgi:hypothetical protein
MKIEIFKASIKDRCPTIRTKDVLPVANLNRYKKGSKFVVTVEINKKTVNLPMHLSRPKDRTIGTHCTTLYGDSTWKDAWPEISTGQKTFIDFVSIKYVG